MNNIVLCGFMGAGKTVVGQELANIMNYAFLDMDEIIEQEQGITIKKIFEIYGEEYFRNLEYELCKRTCNLQNCVISTGGGTVIYERNVNELKKTNKIIFLDASFPVVEQRIGNSDTRPLFKDKEKAKELYNERREKYKNVSDYIIDGDMSAKETAIMIANILNKEVIL